MKVKNLLLSLVLSAAAAVASALEVQPYSAAQLAAAQTAGQPVAVHFHADWCPTCRAQAQVFAALKSDPALKMTVLVANYDTEKALKKQLGVRVQSTLVVFKGQREVARLAGDTAEAKIRGALQAAL